MSRSEEAARRGEDYYRSGFLEAAADWWLECLEFDPSDPVRVRAYDGLGKAAVKRERASEALSWFDQALAIIPDHEVESQSVLAMRRAVALALSGQRDRAFREARELALRTSFETLSTRRQGIILINLAGLELDSDLYEAAIESLTRARHVLSSHGPTPYDYALSTNLGTSYLALGMSDQARRWFQTALENGPAHPIHAVNGLAHMAMLAGHDDDMLHWGQAAFTGMWDSLMSFETEQMAHLSEVLGHMALKLGHGRLAVRLFDQSQGLYGRSGLWGRWRSLNEAMAAGEALADSAETSPVIEEIERFTILMEFMMAQDLVVPRASELADIRLLVASRMADAMGFDADQQRQLTYVIRLADVGLSVVGESGWDSGHSSMGRLYHQHPAMSVRLLDRLGLSESVLDGIRDHHERWDGNGFPEGKRAQNIALTGRIFAVADRYARAAVFDQIRHRAILETIESEAGQALDPRCTDELARVFHAGPA